jgi:hypothetical protein
MAKRRDARPMPTLTWPSNSTQTGSRSVASRTLQRGWHARTSTERPVWCFVQAPMIATWAQPPRAPSHRDRAGPARKSLGCAPLATSGSLAISAERPAVSECRCETLAVTGRLSVPAPEQNQGFGLNCRGDGRPAHLGGLAAGEERGGVRSSSRDLLPWFRESAVGTIEASPKEARAPRGAPGESDGGNRTRSTPAGDRKRSKRKRANRRGRRPAGRSPKP